MSVQCKYLGQRMLGDRAGEGSRNLYAILKANKQIFQYF